MTAFVVYPLLTAALFYLGSRAVITQFIWSRYPSGLAALMDCAACSGTWYGLGVAVAVGNAAKLNFGQLAYDSWYTPPIVALCSMVWTPIVANVLQRSLFGLGSAVSSTESEVEESEVA